MKGVHYFTKMAEIGIPEICCRCGEFLCRLAEVNMFTELGNRKYLFVDASKLHVEMANRNIVRCIVCGGPLGGWFYSLPEVKPTIRLCRHLIIEETKWMFLYRVVDRNNVIIHGEYELMFH